MIQFGEYWSHCSVRIAEEKAAADTNKNPPKPFKNGLTLQVVLKFLAGMPSLAVTLNS